MPEKIKYTLITGASEGLGKALALECASRNHHLILTALPGKELEQLGRFIHRNFAVLVYCFEADLTDEYQCRNLVTKIEKAGLQVNTLINNAGLGGTSPFGNTALQFLEKQILLNVLGTTIITRLLTRLLEENAPSYILNVASLAAFYFLPQKTVYGATKSYLHSFSRSLRLELNPRNISVSVLCPGGINTNLRVTLINRSGNWLARQSILEPELVASHAIRNLLKKKAVIIPGRLNRLIFQVSRILPGFICTALSNAHLKRMSPRHPILNLFTWKRPAPYKAA